MFNTSVELQRTRIGRARDHTFTTERYYTWLRETQYRSSTTRYATVGRAIAADLDTVGPTFAAICAVEEVDRQRQAALSSLAGIEAEVAANSAARREENQWHIDWFVRALTYRYDSYAYALDHLWWKRRTSSRCRWMRACSSCGPGWIAPGAATSAARRGSIPTAMPSPCRHVSSVWSRIPKSSSPSE